MHRRDFLQLGLVSALGPAWLRAAGAPAAEVMTVRGRRPVSELGLVLPHEHVLVDFIGAAEVSPSRCDADVAFAKIKPFFDEAKSLGCRTLFECTPAYLGRDPRLLVRLSDATGLHLVTNTGYYAARQNKFLPDHALREDADSLAARWRREWRDGIDGTGVRPGFIKIGMDAGPLNEQTRTLVRAAARTHRVSGLAIAAHTGNQVAAQEELAILREEGVSAFAWIWVHAQNATDESALVAAARAGAWLSFDGISPRSLTRHVTLVTAMKREGLLPQVLISHDAGWYRPGEPDGGQYRGYDTLFRAFLPALQREGFSEDEIRQLTGRIPRGRWPSPRATEGASPTLWMERGRCLCFAEPEETITIIGRKLDLPGVGTGGVKGRGKSHKTGLPLAPKGKIGTKIFVRSGCRNPRRPPVRFRAELTKRREFSCQTVTERDKPPAHSSSIGELKTSLPRRAARRQRAQKGRGVYC